MIRDEFNNFASPGHASGDLPVRSEIALDPQKYLSDLDGYEMTEDQKLKLLETLWSIARSFVELGFSPDTCGQLWKEFELAAKPESGTVIIEGEVKTGRNPAISPGENVVP